MKIVKIGVDCKVQVWEGTCSKCDSILQEIHTYLNPTYDRADGPFASATCPLCGHGFKLYPNGKYVNELENW